MKIPKTIYLGEKEVEVSIDVEDIAAVLSELPEDDSKPQLFRLLNNTAGFFRAIKDEMIAKLNDSQRETIRNFLTEQASRF